MRSRAFLSVAVALSAFAGACGGSPKSSSDGAGSGGAGVGSSASSTSTGSGPATSGSGGAGSTSTATGSGGGATTATSSSGTGGMPPLAAKPPPGATLCGMGDLKPQDLAAGCTKSPTMTTVTNPQCDAIASTGGHWEAWCFGGGLSYVWLEVLKAKTMGNCNAVVGGGQLPAELMGGNQSYYGATTSGGQGGLVQGIAGDVAVDGVLSFSSMTGKGHLWVPGELDCGMMQSQATLFGFDIDWSTK